MIHMNVWCGVCETGGPDFSGINVFLEIFEFYIMGWEL